MNLSLILATLALAIGSFMNVLDSTIVNVSLTHIAGDFAIAPNQGTWIITSYAVSEAIFLPLVGWMTKRFGVVRQYIWSTILFTIASLLCGMSFSFNFLLFARVLQGIVGASMIPLSQTLMMSLYPKEKRGMAMGIWSITVIVAPVLGPVIGGYITDSFSWRWCFYINLPIGLLSGYLVYSIFKKRGYVEKTQKSSIDIFGLILLILGVGSLQLLLDKGNDLDWFSSNYIKILALCAGLCLIILFIWEWYHENPVVDVRLFKNRNFLIGSLTLTIATIAFFSSVVVIPLWLQNYMGYTAFKSGTTTATSGILVLFIAPVLGSQLHKMDARKVIVFGFTSFSIITISMARFTPDVTSGFISMSRFLSGVGLGFFFVPLNTITLSDIRTEELAAASGLYNFMRNIGTSFGTSLSVNYWSNRMAVHREVMVSGVNASNPSFTSYINQASGSVQAKVAGLNMIIDKQASIMGVNDIMRISGILILFLIPFIFLAKRPNKVVSSGH